MQSGLLGTFVYKAGISGTVTVPVGATLLHVDAAGTNATVVVFGGDSIPVPANIKFIDWDFFHGLCQARPGANTIVFTNTDTYYVSYLTPVTST